MKCSVDKSLIEIKAVKINFRTVSSMKLKVRPRIRTINDQRLVLRLTLARGGEDTVVGKAETT